MGVLGDFTAEHFLTYGLTIIGKKAAVRGLLYGNSLNDYFLEIGGDLNVHAVIEGGHFCQVGGQIKCQFAVRTVNKISSKAAPAFTASDTIHSVLTPGLIDESGRIPVVKERELIEWLAAGKSPFS